MIVLDAWLFLQSQIVHCREHSLFEVQKLFLLPQLLPLTEHSLSHLQKPVTARYYKLITLLAHLLYCCFHKFSFYLTNSLFCSPLLRLKLITLHCYVQTIICSLVSACNSQRTQCLSVVIFRLSSISLTSTCTSQRAQFSQIKDWYHKCRQVFM